MVRGRVIFEADVARFAVDLDDRGVHRIAPGNRLRLPVGISLRDGFDPWRAGDFPARPSGLRHLGEADLRPRYPNHPHFSGAQLEIERRAFQKIGGDCKHLVTHKRELVTSLAAEVLQLAIVRKPIAIAAVSAKVKTTSSGAHFP
jgi:hypothetical protein